MVARVDSINRILPCVDGIIKGSLSRPLFGARSRRGWIFNDARHRRHSTTTQLETAVTLVVCRNLARYVDEVRGRKEGRRAAGWGDAHLNGRHSRLRSVAASSVASREVTGPHLRDAELTASTAISRSCERSNFSADLFRDPSSLPANFIPPRSNIEIDSFSLGLEGKIGFFEISRRGGIEFRMRFFQEAGSGVKLEEWMYWVGN